MLPIRRTNKASGVLIGFFALWIISSMFYMRWTGPYTNPLIEHRLCTEEHQGEYEDDRWFFTRFYKYAESYFYVMGHEEIAARCEAQYIYPEITIEFDALYGDSYRETQIHKNAYLEARYVPGSNFVKSNILENVKTYVGQRANLFYDEIPDQDGDFYAVFSIRSQDEYWWTEQTLRLYIKCSISNSCFLDKKSIENDEGSDYEREAMLSAIKSKGYISFDTQSIPVKVDIDLKASFGLGKPLLNQSFEGLKDVYVKLEIFDENPRAEEGKAIISIKSEIIPYRCSLSLILLELTISVLGSGSTVMYGMRTHSDYFRKRQKYSSLQHKASNGKALVLNSPIGFIRGVYRSTVLFMMWRIWTQGWIQAILITFCLIQYIWFTIFALELNVRSILIFVAGTPMRVYRYFKPKRGAKHNPMDEYFMYKFNDTLFSASGTLISISSFFITLGILIAVRKNLDFLIHFFFVKYCYEFYMFSILGNVYMALSNSLTRNRLHIGFWQSMIKILCSCDIFYHYCVYFIWTSDVPYTDLFLDQIGEPLPQYFFLWATILVLFTCALLELQYEQGSRWFMPHTYRHLLYDYCHSIAEDFELHKLDQSEWPTCDVCFERLDKPSSAASEDVRYSSTDRELCIHKTMRGLYCKHPDGQAYHPQCLVEFIKPGINPDYRELPKVDEYDD